MFLKKKYRVTTRGKIVFPLIAILLIYGIYAMVLNFSVTDEIGPTDSVQENVQSNNIEETTLEKDEVEENVAVTDEEDVINNEASNEDSNIADNTIVDVPDSTKVENCSTNELKEDKEALELRLIEAAGFTVYYEANKYYVPESDLPLLSEFASVALQFTDEQIVIEGNTNTTIGSEDDLDTENIEELGYTRALVIKNYLIKRGVSKERIIIYNNKDEKPLNVDQSTESIALNRRVDAYFSQFAYNEINNK